MAFIKLTRELWRNGYVEREDWYIDPDTIYAFGRNKSDKNKTTVRYAGDLECVFESPEQILLMIESAQKGGAE